MKHRVGHAALSLLLATIATAVIFSGCATTHRSMSYTYPVTAQVPDGAVVTSVVYRCLWKRQDADQLLTEVGTPGFTSGFEQAGALQFDAQVPGHWTTRRGGLSEDRARCSTMLVVAETASGELLTGVVDLPDVETPVTVVLNRTP